VWAPVGSQRSQSGPHCPVTAKCSDPGIQAMHAHLLLEFLFALVAFNTYANASHTEDRKENSKHECPGDTANSHSHCGGHGTCFFGKCFCYPGRQGSNCEKTLSPANPWYTKDCPNLLPDVKSTFEMDTAFEKLGGKINCTPSNSGPPSNLTYCAFLCYAHPEYGVATIPRSIWAEAQRSELKIWNANMGRNDRSSEHFEGFKDYSIFTEGENLGNCAEIGTGPWTQFRGMLHKRPDVKVTSFTVIEPGADFYMKHTPFCAYRYPGKLMNFNESFNHTFPTFVKSNQGELHEHRQFDTVMVMNVIEHTENAFKFLKNAYHTVKPGGTLIMHERFYADPPIGDRVLGHNILHPIRLKKVVFDQFLAQFDARYMRTEDIEAFKRRGAAEQGFWVVGKKLAAGKV